VEERMKMSEKETILMIRERILEYARTAREDGPFANPGRKEPFKGSGLVFIHQPSFRKWLGEKHHLFVSQPQAMMALAVMHAQPRLLNFKNKYGRKVYGIDIRQDVAEVSYGR
jgi:hypothetical protein